MEESVKWLKNEGIEINSVLDVGASDGRWTKQCMASLANAQYALFEAQPVHFDALDSFESEMPNTIHVVKKAVGSVEGVTFFDASDPFSGGLSDKAGSSTIEVPVTTIDSEINAINLPGPYLLKLDTHGYERSILKAATKTLDNCSALIIEAYNHRITKEAFLFWELCQFLSDRGFMPVDLVDVLHRDYDNSLWQMDLVFVKSTWSGFSHVSYS